MKDTSSRFVSISTTKKLKQATASAGLPIEALENRLLLSGNVQASVTADGILRIRGDAGANIIALDQTLLNAGQVRISGTDTTINGQTAPVVLSGVTSKVSVKLGTGRDRVTMSNMSLPGDVVAEQRHLQLNNVQLAGSLTVFSRATISLINTAIGQDLFTKSTSASGDGTATLRDVSVQRNATIHGSTGSDTITIDNAVFRGEAGVFAGLGNDSVKVEASGGALSVPSQFDGPTTIRMGSGDDVLQIGVVGETGNRAIFAHAVSFDGKAGFDTFFNASNNDYQQPAQDVVINFESIPVAQAFIDLGAAAPFAVMATAAISSTGTTHIDGDVGLSPGSSQGIPTAQINGAIHVNDPEVVAARAALLLAYNDAVSRTENVQTLPGNLGGLTFAPGLYENSTSVLIEGSGPGNNLTLDAQGDPNAIFIFKMGSTLTTGPGAQVILAGGAKASNVFWQVGSSATLNTTTIFKGNILASVTITVNTGSVVEGRLLAGSNSDGAVTINASTITVPALPPAITILAPEIAVLY